MEIPNDQISASELERVKQESKEAELESPGSGGAGLFDSEEIGDAKEAGKIEAEAERALHDLHRFVTD